MHNIVLCIASTILYNFCTFYIMYNVHNHKIGNEIRVITILYKYIIR